MIANRVLHRKGSKGFKNFCMEPYFWMWSLILFTHVLNAPRLNKLEASVFVLYISKGKSWQLILNVCVPHFALGIMTPGFPPSLLYCPVIFAASWSQYRWIWANLSVVSIFTYRENSIWENRRVWPFLEQPRDGYYCQKELFVSPCFTLRVTKQVF